MNRFLTLALGAVAGAATFFALQSPRAGAESLTLYGDSPNLAEGRTSLTFAFLDRASGRVVYRGQAKAEVQDGKYVADLRGSGLPTDGLYTVQVSDGGGSQVASTFVNLQTTTPGTAQTGNVNITGTIRAGRAVVTGNLNPTLEVRSTSTATNANTALFEANAASGRGLLAIARGSSGIGGVFQARGATGKAATFDASGADATGIGVLTASPSGIAYGIDVAGASLVGIRVQNSRSSGLGIGISSQAVSIGIGAASMGASGGAGGQFATNATTAGVGVLGGISSSASNTGGVGVQGSAAAGGGRLAVYAVGDSATTGTKSFVIDHPLDPTNRDLWHYSAEGPQPLLEYVGKVRLDASGAAWVQLPSYWSAINRDPTYQLTAIGSAMPNLHVASTVQGNRFRVAGGAANGEVSWRVTGVRNDARMRNFPAPVEAEKPSWMRGYYRMPEAFGFGPDRGAEAAHTALRDRASAGGNGNSAP